MKKLKKKKARSRRPKMKNQPSSGSTTSQKLQKDMGEESREQLTGVAISDCLNQPQVLTQKESTAQAEKNAGPELNASQVETALKDLASLSPIDYDRRREEEAKRLGIRVSTLDAQVKQLRKGGKDEDQGEPLIFEELDPWGSPVCGATLISDMVSILRSHAILPEGAPEAIALWTLNTYVFDAFSVLPLILINSPEKRCGKTSVLTLLSLLAQKPIAVSNISPAALFRTMEKWRPTLLIDEADTFLEGKEELRGVVNSGHTKMTAFVIRAVGDDHDARRFSTWGPKAIAMIGEAPDTIVDRSIRIPLRRKLPGEKVIKIDLRNANFRQMREKCLRWAEDNLASLQSIVVAPLETPNDRAADNWSPLLAIAEVVGGEWPQKARLAATILMERMSDEEPVSDRVQLLMDIREIFSDENQERLRSAKIIRRLAEMEERPWAEWRRGKAITTHQVARLLKDFGIRPKTIRFPDKPAKGYELAGFDDAFARYAPSQNVTPEHACKIGSLPEGQSVTPPDDVTEQDEAKLLGYKRSYDVSDATGECMRKGGDANG